MKSVSIPESVTSIGSGAFYDCTELTTITIGMGAKKANDYAFYNCGNGDIYYMGSKEDRKNLLVSFDISGTWHYNYVPTGN